MPSILRFPQFTVMAMVERSHLQLAIEEKERKLKPLKESLQEQHNPALIVALRFLAQIAWRLEELVKTDPVADFTDELDLAIDTVRNGLVARDEQLEAIRDLIRSIADD